MAYFHLCGQSSSDLAVFWLMWRTTLITDLISSSGSEKDMILAKILILACENSS